MDRHVAIKNMLEWRSLASSGRYHEAWPLYEARRFHPGYRIDIPNATYPEWTDEEVAGRKVMVVAEQGFGDQLMFGRFLRELSARGAEVEILCNPYFVSRLFETMGYTTRPFHLDRPAPPADLWTLFGSLPFRLGIGPPVGAKYLNLPTSSGGGIGVVATGSPLHWNDAQRSLPKELQPWLLRHGRDLLPQTTGARDFLDTATIVAGLDLVITVDTSMAHLAGALGKPCWVLLPRDGLDWRWGDGVRSPWYPDMRLYRQPTSGDWVSVLDAVTRDLEQRRLPAPARQRPS